MNTDIKCAIVAAAAAAAAFNVIVPPHTLSALRSPTEINPAGGMIAAIPAAEVRPHRIRQARYFDPMRCRMLTLLAA